MTNAELLSKIKAEIERRKSLLIQHSKLTYNLILETFIKEYDDLLSFLSTLESEKPMEGLDEEIERYLHSLGVGYGGWVDGMDDDDLRGIARHFAQWQMEQMMKEAVKWLVDDDYHELTEKGRFILGSVGIGYNGYYIPYSDLLKLPKEGEK